MTNIVKKKTRRLKRSIRRTLGTLFLVSALVVAAIPTDGLRQVQADPATPAGYQSDLTWDQKIGKANSKIPMIKTSEENIFTNEDGMFRFAWVQDPSGYDYIAVILGYSAGNLTNNALTIPDTVDAYAKYQKNDGSNGGYVAVSRSREPLYYVATEREEIFDVSGNSTGEFTDPVLMPCSREDKNWDRTAMLNTFYYRDDSAAASDDTAAIGTAYKLKDGSVYVRTDEEAHQWIRRQTVAYIGNQYLVPYPDDSTSTGNNGKMVREWQVAEEEVNDDPSKGVFAGNGNIVRLTIGENLKGLGNYAFYSCANLEYAKFGNGLEEVGKYAFANCTNMTEIGIDFTSNLTYISDYTFYNCRSLRSFAVPSLVSEIYDHAFEGCTDLGRTSLSGVLDLTGSGQDKKVNLEKIGYSVFKNCTGLAEVIFPEAIDNSSDVIDVNNFEGCNSLQHIGALSPYTSFGASTSYTVENFKKAVPESFYFEAAGTSETHEFTKKNAIAFKYSDRDLYEIIIQETKVDEDGNKVPKKDGNGNPIKDADGNIVYDTTEVLYQVNSANELINFVMDGRVAEVQIPTAIGPYGVSAINSGCFSANCYLEKITIPATVTRINEGAFKGCHNLKDVIFANAGSIQYIGQDAFATQVVNLHSTGCTSTDFLNQTPKLTFTGTVGTGIVPFDYAMSASSYINAGSQPKTFITYYSGWPTNLEIQYEENPVTGSGAATLVGYPSFTRLTTSGTYTKDNYPYITSDLQSAAADAVRAYLEWLSNPATEVTANQWEIIRASLNPVIPQGVKAVTSGLFNGAAVTDDGNGGYDVTRVAGTYADTDIQTITFEDLAEYTPYMFDGCTALTTISITGGTAKMDDYAFALKDTSYQGKNYVLSTFNMSAGGSEIGNYAFDNNENLTNVSISPTVTKMGLRPFSNCPNLQTVDFGGGPYFVTDRSIIYGLKDGYKDFIVQCLESRGSFGTAGTVAASELVGITGMAEEAFMGCGEIGTVDLSESSISNVPQNAFRDTKSLYNVSLPTTCRSISKNAFYNSNLRYLAIPNSVSIIDQCAFNTTTYPVDSSDPGYTYPGYKTIEFYCE